MQSLRQRGARRGDVARGLQVGPLKHGRSGSMSARLRRQWVEMTTEDFQQSDMASAIAILPVAAIEQHGPHLPVEVDTAINRGIPPRPLHLRPPALPATMPPSIPTPRPDPPSSI